MLSETSESICGSKCYIYSLQVREFKFSFLILKHEI